MQTVALYVRVSTTGQDTKSQEPDLEAWAKAHSDGAGVHWFRDKFTGTTMDRPGFNKLMDAVRARKVRTVVVWRLDRLGRTAKGLTALFAELTERKVNLVCIKDGFDLNTTAGRFVANMLASAAQYETEVRRERVLAGQAVARARGKRWGGSKKGRRLKVKPEQVEIIRRGVREGVGISALARATGLSRPTIYKIKDAA